MQPESLAHQMHVPPKNNIASHMLCSSWVLSWTIFWYIILKSTDVYLANWCQRCEPPSWFNCCLFSTPSVGQIKKLKQSNGCKHQCCKIRSHILRQDSPQRKTRCTLAWLFFHVFPFMSKSFFQVHPSFLHICVNCYLFVLCYASIRTKMTAGRS